MGVRMTASMSRVLARCLVVLFAATTATFAFYWFQAVTQKAAIESELRDLERTTALQQGNVRLEDEIADLKDDCHMMRAFLEAQRAREDVGFLTEAAETAAALDAAIVQQALDFASTDIDARHLWLEFKRNPIAAEQSWSGRSARVSGQVVSISHGVDGTYAVVLGNGSFMFATCFVSEARSQELITLQIGRRTTVTAFPRSYDMGLGVCLNGCSFGDDHVDQAASADTF